MATLTIRNIDASVKLQALEVIKQHGLTAQTTLESFLRRIVADHAQKEDSCFCHDLELSTEVQQDLKDALSGKVAYSSCKDTPELFAKLGI